MVGVHQDATAYAKVIAGALADMYVLMGAVVHVMHLAEALVQTQAENKKSYE